MIWNAIILLISALVGGGYALWKNNTDELQVKNILVFAGSYLFSVTLVHILPELFEASESHLKIGIFILAGFFFQQLLEYFTHGVEHGHTHVHHDEKEHSVFSGVSLMLALCIHAFLEGTILSNPLSTPVGQSSSTLLLGIVLHKLPAALALMTVLSCQYKEKKTQYVLLIVFSLASPFGILIGQNISGLSFLNTSAVLMLFAFVAGNFLHISTTIFIESRPEHHWNTKKLIISLFGASMAVLAEFFV
jgi:zinc transporter ZupT